MKVKLIKGYSYRNAFRVVRSENPIVTVDEDEGEELLASGYFEKVDEPDPVDPPEDPDDPGEADGEDEDGEEHKYIVPPVDFDKMKLDELKAYAAENEINISGLTKKDDIKARLIEAINSRTPEIFLN